MSYFGSHKVDTQYDLAVEGSTTDRKHFGQVSSFAAVVTIIHINKLLASISILCPNPEGQNINPVPLPTRCVEFWLGHPVFYPNRTIHSLDDS